MPYDFIPIVDGDSLAAGDLKNRFTSVETEINELDQSSILPSSLDNQHIASQVLFSKTKSIPTGGGTHIYTNTDPGTAAVTTSTAMSAPGWFVINSNGQSIGNGDELALYFGSAGSFQVGDETNGVGGILVMANILVNKLHYNVTSYDTNSLSRSPDLYGKFAVQVRNSDTGSWSHLSHTERFIETDTVDQTTGTGIVNVRKDVAMRALIPESSYLGSTDAVRIVCCVRNGAFSVLDVSMVLQHCNLSVMVFHGHMREDL